MFAKINIRPCALALSRFAHSTKISLLAKTVEENFIGCDSKFELHIFI